jgi:plastocyanin
MSGRLRRTLLTSGAIALAVAAAGALPAAAGPGGAAPKTKIVTVADFYFGPSQVTIRKGDAVKWVWAPTNTYSHDVHLRQGPKGLKDKGSYSTRTTAVTDARFKRSFETPGSYRFVCTIHPTKMKLTVTVLGGGSSR